MGNSPIWGATGGSLSKQPYHCRPSALLLLAAAGLWQAVAAAAPVLAELLPMLLATQQQQQQQQQQQAPAAAASARSNTSSNERVLNSAAFLSRGLVELFHSVVSVAATFLLPLQQQQAITNGTTTVSC
jgi:hypothetical protein